MPKVKKAYPDWKHYNDAIYLNNYRINGPKDYNGSPVFNTETNGKLGIDTLSILEALGIPKDIINQIEFED